MRKDLVLYVTKKHTVTSCYVWFLHGYGNEDIHDYLTRGNNIDTNMEDLERKI